MEQDSNDASVKDVQTMSSKEEYAEGMEQSRRSNDVAVKDAQIKSNKEDCAGDMERIAILTMNLLHSLYMVQRMTKRLQLFPISAMS